MEVVGGEHDGHSQEALATYREMAEHFMCGYTIPRGFKRHGALLN